VIATECGCDGETANRNVILAGYREPRK